MRELRVPRFLNTVLRTYCQCAALLKMPEVNYTKITLSTQCQLYLETGVSSFKIYNFTNVHFQVMKVSILSVVTCVLCFGRNLQRETRRTIVIQISTFPASSLNHLSTDSII